MDAQIPTIKDSASLDGIAHEYGKLVSSVYRRMIRDEEVAKEAAQQVWLEIVNPVRKFATPSVKTYLPLYIITWWSKLAHKHLF